MKYGIFGGTFDPFTHAHYEIVNEVLKQGLVDKVIIMPTIVDYYRSSKTSMFSYEQRKQIIEAWFSKRDDAILDFYEYDFRKALLQHQELSEPVSSRRYIHMLRDLKSRHPDADSRLFTTIVGGDSWNSLDTWNSYEQLLDETQFIVIRRDEADLKVYCHINGIPAATISICKKFEDISATEVRRHLREDRIGDSFYVYLEEIEDYLKTRKTWKEKLEEEAMAPTEESTLLAHTPIFDVVQAAEVEEGFRPVKVKSPDWVSVIAEKDGQFMMVKQLRHGISKEVEEFPCGMVDKGEEPFDAAVRELAEETGIVLLDAKNDMKLLGKCAANPAFMTNYMHYFYVNLGTAQYSHADQNLDAHEHLTTYLVDSVEALHTQLKESGSSLMAAAWLMLAVNGVLERQCHKTTEMSSLSSLS